MCKELSEGVVSFQLPVTSRKTYWKLGTCELATVIVSFEFLMVKLLRAYGECLGARSL